MQQKKPKKPTRKNDKNRSASKVKSPADVCQQPSSVCQRPSKKGRKVDFTSKRFQSKLKANNLPSPDPNLQTSEFAKLQKQWYDKLSKSGFSDIEWVDHKTGQGHNSAFLKGSYAGGRPYHAGRDLYFSLASNYLQHSKGILHKYPYYRFIWKMHCNGATYSEIHKAAKKRFKKTPSIYTLFYQLKKIGKLCFKWNQTNQEGLLKKREEDKQKFDELGLASFYDSEYNWLLSGPEPVLKQKGNK